jgi:hypothetical protein
MLSKIAIHPSSSVEDGTGRQDLWRAETCVLKRGTLCISLGGGAFVNPLHVAATVTAGGGLQV